MIAFRYLSTSYVTIALPVAQFSLPANKSWNLGISHDTEIYPILSYRVLVRSTFT